MGGGERLPEFVLSFSELQSQIARPSSSISDERTEIIKLIPTNLIQGRIEITNSFVKYYLKISEHNVVKVALL